MILVLTVTLCLSAQPTRCHPVTVAEPEGMMFALPLVCAKAAQEYASEYINLYAPGEFLRSYRCHKPEHDV